MTDSLYLQPEQAINPWSSSRSRDEDPTLTAITTRCQRSDTDSVFHNDAAVRPDGNMILSPSPPPPSPHPPPPMQTTDETAPDPRIASLKSIFPDFDDAVILSVLESTDDDHDRALDVLLGMSDPSFVAPNPPRVPSPDPFESVPSADDQRLSQEALDEQLARRLALEEQQNAVTPEWHHPQATEGRVMYQPYQPRRGRNGWGDPPQGQPQAQGQGAMTEFQEGFNRIAESGKKTFSSIVSKVKAKMQEFDHGQGGWSWYQNSSNQPPGSASYPSSYAPGQQGSGQGAYSQPYQPVQPAYPQRQTSLSRTSSSPPRSGVLHPATTVPANLQQPSYYDPNAQAYDLYGDEEEVEVPVRVRATPSTTATPAVVAPATVAMQSSATSHAADSPAPPPPLSEASSMPNVGLNTPSRSHSPATRSTTAGTPGGVDFSKLGLLPKRPISLVRPQSPPSAGASGGTNVTAPRVAPAHSQSTTNSSTDHEEPEFVENPFEDPR